MRIARRGERSGINKEEIEGARRADQRRQRIGGKGRRTEEEEEERASGRASGGKLSN